MCSLGLNLGYSVRTSLTLANDSVHQSSMNGVCHGKAFPNERNSQGNRELKLRM